MELVYPRERVLGAITLVLGIIAWIALVVGTFGVALLFIGVGFIAYLFLQSGLIAYLRGDGVQLSDSQLPELYAEFKACCEHLKLEVQPDCYIVNGNGVLNAFATRFLGRNYVVLNSSVLAAMAGHPDGVRFYMGHELGHVRMKHLTGHMLRWPVLWLPLLGAAYSRARESTCDLHGLACSGSSGGAARALTALSAGPETWQHVDPASYERQASMKPGFWMSFHELTRGYPWLAKRFARATNPGVTFPSRNPFAYVLGLFVPYAGRLGGGFGFLMLVYVIAIVSAIAIPAYQDYTTRAYLQTVVVATAGPRDALGGAYERTQEVPKSLEQLGIADTLPDGSGLELDTEGMQLTVHTAKGDLIFVPQVLDDKSISWTCEAGEKLKPAHLPPSCRGQ
jgi:Zn-dependent protease with chaperone function